MAFWLESFYVTLFLGWEVVEGQIYMILGTFSHVIWSCRGLEGSRGFPRLEFLFEELASHFLAVKMTTWPKKEDKLMFIFVQKFWIIKQSKLSQVQFTRLHSVGCEQVFWFWGNSLAEGRGIWEFEDSLGILGSSRWRRKLIFLIFSHRLKCGD